MRTKGWGPWKKIWYSLCSEHKNYDNNCNLCNVGSYRNDLGYSISSVIFKISPKFWMWWIN